MPEGKYPKPLRAWRAAWCAASHSSEVRAGPRGQPGAASRGGELPGQQPRIAARYRQAGRQSLGCLELGEPRGRSG
eukprot:scaffold54061_cov67-Phaeocystis_antarctica.AAC.1